MPAPTATDGREGGRALSPGAERTSLKGDNGAVLLTPTSVSLRVRVWLFSGSKVTLCRELRETNWNQHRCSRKLPITNALLSKLLTITVRQPRGGGGTLSEAQETALLTVSLQPCNRASRTNQLPPYNAGFSLLVCSSCSLCRCFLPMRVCTALSQSSCLQPFSHAEKWKELPQKLRETAKLDCELKIPRAFLSGRKRTPLADIPR